MLLFRLYRLYAAVGSAIGAGLWLGPWRGVLAGISVRTIWWIVEQHLARLRIDRLYSRHCAAFKQLCGPYGIRMANKAEQDPRIKRSLAEVFEPNPIKLKRTMQTLETMDALFKAGMRPEADELLLHDLKLKYGRHRLEMINKTVP